MNKTIKIILIISIAFLSAGFLFVLPANATTVVTLFVEYSSDGGNNWLPLSGPIFNETNFLPGNDVTRLIRVTNNSGQTQRIATEAINKIDSDHLSEKLNLVIKEGATEIFNKTLKEFFNQGETYLSDLGNGLTTQYDFTVSFNSDADNSFQGKTLGFDILVGFEGTEGGLPLPPSGGGTGGGGGGSSLPSGLTIYNEATETVTGTSVTITWTTSYYSTSQVIYAAEGETINGRSHTLNLSDDLGAPPYYGYARTTPEYDTVPKVINHSVTINGLNSGTTYYYRTVSHASLAIGQEYIFTTTGEKQQNIPPAETSGNEITEGNIGIRETIETTTGETTLTPEVAPEIAPQTNEGAEAVAQEKSVIPPLSTDQEKLLSRNLNLFSALAIAGKEISKSGFHSAFVIILIVLFILVISGTVSQWHGKIKRRGNKNNLDK